METQYCLNCRHPESDHIAGHCNGHTGPTPQEVKSVDPNKTSCKCTKFVPKPAKS